MRLRSHVVAAAILVTSGCSYTFTVGPHERSLGGTPGACTTSRVPPVADTVIAIASAVAAAAAIYACQESSHTDDDAGCIRAILLVPPAAASAMLFGMSAGRGFRDTAGCEQDRQPVVVGAVP